jgi:PST family polysaccharide transporter
MALPPEQEANRRASSGIKWNLLEQAGVSTIAFFATLILSRMLTPEDFGLFGMPTVISNMLVVMVTLGLNYSIIQNRDLDKRDIESLFWLSFGAGLFIACVFYFGAPIMADLYQQPSLEAVAKALSVVFLFHGMSSVPLGILIKRMDFRSLAIAQVSASAASYTIAIFLAMKGYAYWSLVAQALTFNGILVSINLFVSGWRPEGVFRLSSLSKVRRFSVQFTGNQLLEFTASNMDAFLTGRFLGSRNLGLMGRAQALSMVPVTSFGFILNRTFFPWFAALETNPAELRHRYLQSSGSLIVVMFPLLTLLGIASDDVVILLFGSQWTDVAPLLSMYCWYAAFNCVNLFHDSFMTSQGRTGTLIRIALVEKAVLVTAITVGLFTSGLVGVVLAKAITSTVFFGPRLFYACRFAHLPVSTWLSEQRIKLAFLGLTAVIAWLLMQWIAWPLAGVRALMVAALSLAIYYVSLRRMREPSMEVIERVLRDQLGIRAGKPGRK